MEVWQHGTPPRTYRVVGTIEDKRRGIYGNPSAEAQVEIFRALVAKAHTAHADAIIIVSQTHLTEKRTTYRYVGTVTGAPYFEYDSAGHKSLVTPEPLDIEKPDGYEEVDTDELQTRAQAITYQK